MKGRLNTLSALIVLILIIGFPRFYGTEVPMAIILIPFFFLGFIRTFLRLGVFSLIFLSLFFFGFVLGVVSYFFGEGHLGDIFFHLVIYLKILLVFFFAYVVSQVIYGRLNVLLYWIVFQIFVVLLAFINAQFYDFLLGFISPRSAEIFKHLFGLRSLGFGLFHMEGSITLVFAVFLYVLLSGVDRQYLAVFLALLSFPFAMAVARSAIVPFSVFAFFSKGIVVKASVVLAFLLMFLIAQIVESGAMYEAVEIFRNIISGQGAYSESVAHLPSMYSLPDNLSTYLIGDGKYYSGYAESLSFYMNSDVGYIRILYFSGLFSLLIFIALNVFFNFIAFAKLRGQIFYGYRSYFLVSLVVFLIINAKGVQVAPFFGLVLFYYAFKVRSDSNRC